MQFSVYDTLLLLGTFSAVVFLYVFQQNVLQEEIVSLQAQVQTLRDESTRHEKRCRQLETEKTQATQNLEGKLQQVEKALAESKANANIVSPITTHSGGDGTEVQALREEKEAAEQQVI